MYMARASIWLKHIQVACAGYLGVAIAAVSAQATVGSSSIRLYGSSITCGVRKGSSCRLSVIVCH